MGQPATPFAQRLAIACRDHPEAPAAYGQQAWVRRQLLQQGTEVSATAVSHWFSGRTRPRPEMIEALGQALSVDVRWLATDEGRDRCEDWPRRQQ